MKYMKVHSFASPNIVTPIRSDPLTDGSAFFRFLRLHFNTLLDRRTSTSHERPIYNILRSGTGLHHIFYNSKCPSFCKHFHADQIGNIIFIFFQTYRVFPWNKRELPLYCSTSLILSIPLNSNHKLFKNEPIESPYRSDVFCIQNHFSAFKLRRSSVVGSHFEFRAWK